MKIQGVIRKNSSALACGNSLPRTPEVLASVEFQLITDQVANMESGLFIDRSFPVFMPQFTPSRTFLSL